MKHVLINNGVVIAAGEGVEFGHVGADERVVAEDVWEALKAAREALEAVCSRSYDEGSFALARAALAKAKAVTP